MPDLMARIMMRKRPNKAKQRVNIRHKPRGDGVMASHYHISGISRADRLLAKVQECPARSSRSWKKEEEFARDSIKYIYI